MSQIKIPAAWMRGGTSKGVFFRGDVLPADAALRDRILLRVLGSPDPYGKQMDGLGGATSSTSKAVIVSRSTRPECDVDYLFAAVDIGKPVLDYSGSCGNLVAAVGPFAIEEGMVAPVEGITTVRIWQVNTRKKIIAHVPVKDGMPVVDGDYWMDGVAFPGAEIYIEFLDPGGAGGGKLLPTGNVVDFLEIPGLGRIEASLVDAGNPTVFIRAADVGLSGAELAANVDGNPELLSKLEAVRARGAVAMGLAETPEEATAKRPATPKVAFVAPPKSYVSSKDEMVSADSIDLTARILSMGKLHHAFTGTGSIATAVAAVLPGSLVQEMCPNVPPGQLLRIGHPSGRLEVGAAVIKEGGGWKAQKAIMRRTARRLMEGHVLIPRATL